MCVKLKELGLDGCYLKWVRNFLTDRKQYVTYKKTCSNLMDVTFGVIQGSAIGLCVFTVFINDLCKVIQHARPSLFADDFKMVGDVSTPEDCSLMKSDLQAVGLWSADNKLPISLEKLTVMHNGATNICANYVISGQLLVSEDSCMDLGVLQSKTFCYNKHAQKVALKATKLTGMMMKIFSSRKPAFLRKFFVSYNRPTLEYAAPVWSPSSIAMCDTLERVQRRFTKRTKGNFKLKLRWAFICIKTRHFGMQEVVSRRTTSA